MATLTTCELADGVLTVVMDDGKANALSFAMLEELSSALDAAVDAGAAVVLAGREGRFSGGFDLGVLTAFNDDSARLLRTGFELSHRLLSFPRPVVVAVTGHAYAMGSFLVLSGDYRIGAAGADHRMTANEVAIGMALPHAALEVCRQRLTPACFERATILAEVFGPDQAVDAGWLDAAVPESELLGEAQAKAAQLAGLDAKAHETTKLRSRHEMLARLEAAIERDDRELRAAIASAGEP